MTKLKQKLSTAKIEKKLLELYKIQSELTELWQRTKLEEVPVVSKNDIAAVVSRMTGVPLDELTEEEKIKLLNIENRIQERVVGQDRAVEIVSSAIRRSRAGLKEINRPIGSFLFLGPSGVGKSELSKTLAEVLYGSEDLLVRIDMSEFMEKHTVSRLIGAPPGYIGFDEGGQLTELVRRRPFSVILFDEIEKAHPEVVNILLQIMEDGRLTDGQGRMVDFKNCILIMTSNIGSEMIYETTLGFSPGDDKGNNITFNELKSRVLDTLTKSFRPEFINRIDEIVVFKSLDKTDISKIVRLELDKVAKRLAANNLRLSYTKRVVACLAEKGYDPKYGARPIKRVIRQEVENPISDRILRAQITSGETVRLGAKKKEIMFTIGRKKRRKNAKRK